MSPTNEKLLAHLSESYPQCLEVIRPGCVFDFDATGHLDHEVLGNSAGATTHHDLGRLGL